MYPTHEKNSLLILLLLWSGAMYAQDLTLFSTAGGFSSNNDMHLSWSVGEPVISYEAIGNTWLTQGYQQPGHIDLMVSTDESSIHQPIAVYPNPATSSITLSGIKAAECYMLQFHNLVGQHVLTVPGPTNHSPVTIDALQPGWYILTVQCNDTQYRSTSIIKL
jgi:hypothetical protein